MVSRRQTREFLLQALYAQGEGKEYDRDMFIEAYFSDEEYQLHLDAVYLDRMEKEIHDHEGELLVLVSRLAPKFELSTMPLLHILILMIALSEMLYVADLDIPEPVSVNEAIELAKKFSDEQGKSFVNGALSTFLKHRSDFLDLSSENLSFRVF